jgi:hypothetical protein
MERIRSSSFALLMGCAILWPNPSAADGALAIGLPSNVAKQGLAMGFGINFPNKGEAEARALKECLGFKDAPAATRAFCKVVETFKDQCLAIALDPKYGTPGVGWAVAADEQAAGKTALQKCVATAGPSRRDFCKVLISKCDRPKTN